MMWSVGAREELLSAVESLKARGVEVFSPAQLLAEARSAGSTYPDTTLRTFIVGPMCANSPDNHATQYGDLERVARGLYRKFGGGPLAPSDDPEVTLGDQAGSPPGCQRTSTTSGSGRGTSRRPS